jgi:DNA-binding LacI/PurR family transcriptional regulator
MKKNYHKITIHELASDLDLAPGTVSKILNGKGTISHQTRQRVTQRAKELGYVASSSARILKASHSWTIGIVFSDIALFGLEHPFFGSIIQAFKNYMEDRGYEIVFIPKKLGTQQQTYLQWAKNKSVDGVLILTGDQNDTEFQELIHADVPCVSTDIYDPHVATVISNDTLGVELIFKHFIQLGFQKIYAYSGSVLSRAYQQRTDAFHACVRQYHSDADLESYLTTDHYGVTHYYEQALKWIQRWQHKPEAIIAFSDDIAMGLIRALNEMGYRVPEDISVSGYDDIQFAKLFSPALTTIRQDKKLIAETAAELLLSMIQENQIIKGIKLVPVELIIRQSTKRIKP